MRGYSEKREEKRQQKKKKSKDELSPIMQQRLQFLKPNDQAVSMGELLSMGQIKEEDYVAYLAARYRHLRQRFRQHGRWTQQMAIKLRLKKDAILALPPELRAAAEAEDKSLFPSNRVLPTHGPPTEGRWR